MKSYRGLVAALFFYSLPVSSGPVELSDQRTGMTCRYYHTGVRLEWERQGGDWRDAQDVTHGDAPYAKTTVAKARTPQTVEWDITKLVRRWQQGTQPVGGIYLRQLPGSGASVKFLSRQAQPTAKRPRLLIEWTDGSFSELGASADTTISCSSLSSKGDKKNMEVNKQRSAILIFPFVAKGDSGVRAAHLILHSPKQYGSSSDIGVFQLSVPFTRPPKSRQGLAAGFQADTGITSHPAVVFATGFESSDWLEEWSARKPPKSAKRVLRDSDNLFEPLDGAALKATIRKGTKTGLKLLYRFQEKHGSEPEEMYFRYYLRLGDNWRPIVSGKMPGFAGTYNRAGWGGRRSDGTNGWSTRGRYSISKGLADGKYSLGSYVYHAGMTKKYGSGWGWGLGPTGVIERNRWYSVEQYTKLNTPGKSDGELKAWLDGRLVFDRKGMRFRDIRDLRIETLWMNVYHGGTKKTPRDISLYIDNVVIAREYIGPANGLPLRK